MNQHINRGCGILKTISTKKARMPQLMNPGKKALMIALVKLGLYEAPTSYAFCLFSSSLIHSNSNLLPRAWDSASDEILNRSSLLILLFDPVHKKGFSHLRIERNWWLCPNFDSYNQGSFYIVKVYILHLPEEYFW